VNESLQQGAKGSTGGLHTNRLRAFLVVSQVSLSLLLLAGAGLLIKSFLNLRATNPGFDPLKVMTMSISLPRIRYPETDQQVRTYDLIMQKLAAIPGVETAGGVNPLPLGQNQRSSTFMPSGAAPLPRGNHPGASHLTVKPDYFKAMKIPILQGRDFARSDTKDSPLVVMINEAFAQKHFPGINPIGQQVMIDRPQNQAPPCEVVGVVANTRHDSLSEPQGPEMYVPFDQEPGRSLDIVLRVSATNLMGLNADVKRAVREVDKDLYVPTLEPMTTFVATHLAQPRFNMMLLGVFAGVAMTLQRRAADPRDRHPHGARRAEGADARNGPSPEPDPCGHRPRYWLRPRAGCDAGDEDIALWCRRERLLDLCPRHRAAWGGGLPRQLRTRAPRHESRSDGGASV
jgi:putative ABC transport system permease protein